MFPEDVTEHYAYCEGCRYISLWYLNDLEFWRCSDCGEESFKENFYEEYYD